MNFLQSILLIGLLIGSRAVVKNLLLAYYYTSIGDALATFLTLGGTIMIARVLFRKQNLHFFPLNRIPVQSGLLVVSTILFLFLIATVVGQLEMLLQIGADSFFQGRATFGWTRDMTKYFLGILVVAPVLEELFFRGILLQGLLKRHGHSIAIVVTTLFFASFHFNIDDLNGWKFLVTDKIAVVLFGTFAAWLVVKASNIRFVIFLHVFWNLLHYLFPLFINLIGVDLTNPGTFAIFSILILSVSIWLLTRNIIRLRSAVWTAR